MLRINFYRVKRGDNLGDPEYWNQRFEDLDLRIGKAEDALQDVDAVADRVEAVALDRIDNVITPLVNETVTRLQSVPNLFTAHSASAVTAGSGEKTFEIDADHRNTWAVADIVYVEKTTDPTVWLSGRVQSFDRLTGIVVVDVTDYAGSGSHSDWTFGVAGRRGPVGATGAMGLTPRGVYSGLASYAERDVVRYDRSAWVAKVATTPGNGPPALPITSNTWWQLLVERGGDAQATGAFETEFVETVSGGPKATFTITGGYSVDAAMLIFLNGIKLAAEDYTATNGTTVVLDAAANDGDIFEFKAFATFGVGEVLMRDLALSDLDDPDAALVNLGSTSLGRDLFKIASAGAARTALSVYSTTEVTAAIASAIATAITNLINSSPTQLDTLNEFAAALGNDANFAATTAAALGNRVRYDAPQTLNASQKTQALGNVGLYTPLFITDGGSPDESDITMSAEARLSAVFTASSPRLLVSGGCTIDLSNPSATIVVGYLELKNVGTGVVIAASKDVQAAVSSGVGGAVVPLSLAYSGLTPGTQYRIDLMLYKLVAVGPCLPKNQFIHGFCLA